MAETEKITRMVRHREMLVVRRRQAFLLFCEKCSCESDFVALDDTVLFSGLSTRQVIARVDAGVFHSKDTEGGQIFICRRSVMQ